LKPNDKVFLRLPTEDAGKRRVLRPATVLAVDAAGCALQLEDVVALVSATEAFVHFEAEQKFWQQSVRVGAVEPERPGVLRLQFLGMPVSGESRQAFRVSCLGANIQAKVGDEAACEVVDLSVTGFAFYAESQYQVGHRLPVLLVHDGKEYRSLATIQSARSLDAKRSRYGAHCTDGANDNLAKSLAALGLAVQSEQLRRLASG
jgi:hypothetical protein